jgi:hypothetical protein
MEEALRRGRGRETSNTGRYLSMVCSQTATRHTNVSIAHTAVGDNPLKPRYASIQRHFHYWVTTQETLRKESLVSPDMYRVTLGPPVGHAAKLSVSCNSGQMESSISSGLELRQELCSGVP